MVRITLNAYGCHNLHVFFLPWIAVCERVMMGLNRPRQFCGRRTD